MAAKPLTQEELLKVAGVMGAAPSRPSGPIRPGTQDAEQQTHVRPAGEGVPVEKVAQPAPPKKAAPKKAAPGPTPTQVAAETGVAPQVPNSPMAPPSADRPASAPLLPGALPQAPEGDAPAFHYLPAVEAAEKKAIALGRFEIAAEVRDNYNRLIDGQYRSMETEWKTKTLPQVQAIQKALLDHQGKQVPAELAMKARETVSQAATQQQQMLAFLYGLARNDSTRGLAIQYFNESDIHEPGVKVANIVVQGDNVMGIDDQGKIVNLSTGQAFSFPVKDAEALYNQFYGSTRTDNIIVPAGGAVLNTSTGQVFRNPKDESTTPSDQLSSVKYATDIINQTLGIKLDSTGQMIENVGAATREQAAMLAAQAGALIRGGMTPEQAATTVLNQYKAAGVSGGQQGSSGPSLKELMGGSN